MKEMGVEGPNAGSFLGFWKPVAGDMTRYAVLFLFKKNAESPV